MKFILRFVFSCKKIEVILVRNDPDLPTMTDPTWSNINYSWSKWRFIDDFFGVTSGLGCVGGSVYGLPTCRTTWMLRDSSPFFPRGPSVTPESYGWTDRGTTDPAGMCTVLSRGVTICVCHSGVGRSGQSGPVLNLRHPDKRYLLAKVPITYVKVLGRDRKVGWGVSTSRSFWLVTCFKFIFQNSMSVRGVLL